MDAGRYRLLYEIFTRARAAPAGADRAALVAEACGGDASLIAELERLLAADAKTPGPEVLRLLPDIPPMDETLPANRGASEAPGDRIGPYTLVEIIGAGGFGTVWLAERHEPMMQRVAVKIMNPGMDSRAIIARFEQERQALALMDHPAIAKVLDAGMTARGRPYFVMEHVAGSTITAYCDRQRLAIRERLALLAAVCNGVQYAHHKGLIHRDLKPSNILISVHDGVPAPKIIDFGIAKALSGSLARRTVFTESGQMMGTPEYMPPEQAEAGEDVDTRADVYSLGVVLYELLTGQLPLSSEQLRSGGARAVPRLIRELAPPKPSARVAELGFEARENIGERRGVAPGQLVVQLRRELDWIPLKAMRKDRADRYESPNELARDITNYLEGRALEAGPESTVYRVRKMVRQHRGPVAAIGAVAAALVLGAVGFAWQAQRAGVQRDAAAAERDRARALNEFIVACLKSEDPIEQGQRDMTVSDALREAARNLTAGGLGQNQANRALLLRTIAGILDHNSESVEAQPLAELALKIEKDLHAGDHPDVATSIDLLGMVQGSLAHTKEAEALYRQSLAMRQRLFAHDHEDVADSLNNLGHALLGLRRFDEADPLLTQALEMRRRLFKGDAEPVANSLNNLASLRHSQKRVAEAEELFVQALDMERRLRSGDNPRVCTLLNNIGYVQAAQGRLVEAEKSYREALEMCRRLSPRDHASVATTLSNLGKLQLTRNELPDADACFSEALEMRRRLFQTDNIAVVASLSDVARARDLMGDQAGAERRYLEALEMIERMGKPRGVMTALNSLTTFYIKHDRPADAEPLLWRWLTLREAGRDDAAAARNLVELARCLAKLGRAGDASAPMKEAMGLADRAWADDPAGRAAFDESAATVRKDIDAVAAATKAE